MSICQSLFAIDPLLDSDPLLTIVGSNCGILRVDLVSCRKGGTAWKHY